ncbi:hypothetical protein PMAYCL1PPCAC_14837, partial [Pristionchus mayeri]
TMLGRLLVAGALLATAHASYCGESMVPFSFEVLASGQPVLGCARPTCFGWAPSGQPYSHQATFYRIRGTADGFTRVEDPVSIPPFVQGDVRFHKPQAAHCEPGFGSISCAGANSWIGGIAPLINLTSYPTTVRCCVYEPLNQSEDRGVASVAGGQIVVGGEVFSDGIQYAFDYISDVTKHVNFDRSVQYDVAIRRFACAPLPGPTRVVDNEKEVKHADIRFAPRAYQDPLQAVSEPLAPPARVERQHGSGSHGHSHGSHGSHGSHSHGSHSHGSHGSRESKIALQNVQSNDFEENGVIEEIVREEGVQLPPGTQFQQQPLPVQQPPPVQPAPQFYPPQYAPVAPVAAQAGYFPVAAQSGGFWLCFSGDMTVQMADGSEKQMDQLEKNDFVLSMTPSGITHVPVSFWLHRNPEAVAEFHRFETEDGRTIKLTAQHYIYKGDCANVGQTLPVEAVARSAVYAEEVSEGDCLYTVDGENVKEVRVVKADRVTETGIYAPMTSNGKIVVGGVYASCHTSVHSHTIQKTYFSAMNSLRAVWASVFGESDNSFIDTPYGLDLFKSVLDLIAPKGLTTF